MLKILQISYELIKSFHRNFVGISTAHSLVSNEHLGKFFIEFQSYKNPLFLVPNKPSQACNVKYAVNVGFLTGMERFYCHQDSNHAVTLKDHTKFIFKWFILYGFHSCKWLFFWLKLCILKYMSVSTCLTILHFSHE